MTLLAQILAMLTGAYNRSPGGNIGKLLKVYADGTTEVQETLQTIEDWRDIHTARGMVLDRFGLNYGVAREGTDDDLYRLKISTKMMARLSAGDGDTLIRATAALLGIADEDVVLTEEPGHAILSVNELELPTQYWDRITAIADLLSETAAAGIRLTLELETPMEQILHVGIVVQDVEHLTIRQVF